MHHPSVSWQTIPLKFFRWNITCFWQKSPSVYNVSDFECSNESLPNFPFLKTQGQGLLIFCITVQWRERSLLRILQLKLHILWTKITHRSKIFGFLGGWVKINQFPHVIFETTIEFFSKLCIILSVMWDNSSVFF